MIIDCHGHFTTAPDPLATFRTEQLARLDDPSRPAPRMAEVSDQQLQDAVEPNQLRVLDERGGDLLLFSPKASAMAHHVPDPDTAGAWARVSNDLVHRVTELYPDRFAPVCQLPQTPDGGLEASIAEVRRCVEQLGFVGCNLNPDPSGGHWTSQPMTDEVWFPLYETLVELDVPAMIHVSASCNPNAHTLGAHYLNADTAVFMQLLLGDLFAEFPTLRLVLPHGGGAVPYHWGRYHGLAARLERPPIEQHLLDNVFFDTCVYHQPGIDLLHEVVGPANLLFASEMLGAVRGVNPQTGSGWDDTKAYVDRVSMDDAARQAVFEDNVRRVYPRLDARLPARRSPGASR